MPSSPDGRLSRSLDIELLSLLRGSRAFDSDDYTMPFGIDTSAEWNWESLAHFRELRRTGHLNISAKVALLSAAEAGAAVEACFETRFFSQIAQGVLHSPFQREHSLESPFSAEELDASPRLGSLWAAASPLNSPFSSLPQWIGAEQEREVMDAQVRLLSRNNLDAVDTGGVCTRFSSDGMKPGWIAIKKTLQPLLDLMAEENDAETQPEGISITPTRSLRPQSNRDSHSCKLPHHHITRNLSPLLSTHMARTLRTASELSLRSSQLLQKPYRTAFLK